MGSMTALFGRSPRVAILEAFAQSPGQEYSVPELVEETRVSKRGLYMHVRKLMEEGLLKRTAIRGKCVFYSLNENDKRSDLLPLFDSIITVGRLEREIKRDLGLSPLEPLWPLRGMDLSLVTKFSDPIFSAASTSLTQRSLGPMVQRRGPRVDRRPEPDVDIESIAATAVGP